MTATISALELSQLRKRIIAACALVPVTEWSADETRLVAEALETIVLSRGDQLRNVVSITTGKGVER
jgi:hypothetical protein